MEPEPDRGASAKAIEWTSELSRRGWHQALLELRHDVSHPVLVEPDRREEFVSRRGCVARNCSAEFRHVRLARAAPPRSAPGSRRPPLAVSPDRLPSVIWNKIVCSETVDNRLGADKRPAWWGAITGESHSRDDLALAPKAIFVPSH